MKEKKRDIKNVDIVALKRKKKKRRQLVKFAAFLLVVLIGIWAYVKIDEWFPRLEGFGNHFHSVRSNGDGINGKNFPLTISGGIDYQVNEVDDSLAILSDAYLYIFDDDGELYDERQHSYANAMMQSSGEKLLIYESGGTHFRVDGRGKMLFEKRLGNKIDFARISENGDVAVISESDTYVCKLTVFDDSGDEIYSRNCVERVIDVDFTDDGDGCVLATSFASEGRLMSKLIALSFDSKDDRWNSEPFDTLALKAFCTKDGTFLIGEKKCAYFSDGGDMDMSYDYPSTLVDWDFDEKGLVLLFDNVTKRCSYFTTISSDKKTPNEKSFDNVGAKCVRLSGDRVLMMDKDGIKRYGFKGSDEETINGDASFDRFFILDDSIFLLGYDRIDRIEYSD